MKILEKTYCHFFCNQYHEMLLLTKTISNFILIIENYIHNRIIRALVLRPGHTHKLVLMVSNSFQCTLFSNKTRKQIRLVNTNTKLLRINLKN